MINLYLQKVLASTTLIKDAFNIIQCMFHEITTQCPISAQLFLTLCIPSILLKLIKIKDPACIILCGLDSPNQNASEINALSTMGNECRA